MNLRETVEWAAKIDETKVEPKKRYMVKCYKSMILEKSKSVEALTKKVSGYMDDIAEYIEQLGKMNVRQQPEKSVEPAALQQDNPVQERKSPLLP
jgi:hypothetical protein